MIQRGETLILKLFKNMKNKLINKAILKMVIMLEKLLMFKDKMEIF